MTWLQQNSGAVQAIATIVLVAVTVVYVYFTRSLANKAKEQAEAAKAQADAAMTQADAVKESLSRAFEDGILQQAQLVQRQAILAARSELAVLLATSLDWLLNGSVLASRLADDDFAEELRSPGEHGSSLEYNSDRCEELESSDSACDLDYLEDFVGAFPLSATLLVDFFVDGHRARSALSSMGFQLSRARSGNSVDATQTQQLAKSLLQITERLRGNLIALRHTVRTTGYARAFGNLPLDSPDFAKATSQIVIRDGEWHLRERPPIDAKAPQGG
jgi:hypothetical protein